jgi:hypothetical protein
MNIEVKAPKIVKGTAPAKSPEPPEWASEIERIKKELTYGGANSLLAQEAQHYMNQQIAQSLGMMQPAVATAPIQPIKQKVGGWYTNIEMVEDGFVVEVHEKNTAGTNTGKKRRFIASTIQEATEKIAAGIALMQMDV